MFTKYPVGFTEYNAWSAYVHDMWDLHDLECESFGEEWLQLWEALGKLMNAHALAQFWDNGRWWTVAHGNAGACLEYCIKNARKSNMRRTVLLDGTVIREWGTH
jgi:hypothetical protein